MDNLMRRVYPTLIYKEKDISEDLQPYLLSITSTDNLEGELDSIKISVLNQDNKFLDPKWSPEKKEILTFGIKTLNWENELEGFMQSNIGTYYIDEKTFDKKIATWKGISAPLNSKNEKNSKTWETVSMKRLGEEFANKYNLEFQYLVSGEITLTDLIQENETDFSFLNKIAKEEGIKLKITNKKLVLFDEKEFQKKEAVYKIDLQKVEDYRINDKSNEIYDAVEVTEFDPIALANKTVTKTKAELEGKIGGSKNKVLKIKARSKSGDLDKYCLKMLEQVNKQEKIIILKVVGDRRAYAGLTFELINAGYYSGKYMMKKVKQILPKFTTEIEAYLIGGEDD